MENASSIHPWNASNVSQPVHKNGMAFVVLIRWAITIMLDISSHIIVCESAFICKQLDLNKKIASRAQCAVKRQTMEIDSPVEGFRDAVYHITHTICTMPYVTYDIFPDGVLFPVIIERKPWKQRIVAFILICVYAPNVAHYVYVCI